MRRSRASVGKPWVITRRVGVFAVSAVLSTTLFASVASADDEITAVAGYGGKLSNGGPVPVTAQIKVDRLVQGTLHVSAELPDFGVGVNSETVIPVEVAAGTTKTYSVVLPDPMPIGSGMFGGMMNLRVNLVLRGSDGRSIDQQSANVSFSGLPIAGILPGVVPTGGKVPATVNVPPKVVSQPEGGGFVEQVGPDGIIAKAEPKEQSISIWPVALDVTTKAPWGGLSQIVATNADLGRMSEAWRDELITWVAGGGRLVIDSKPGQVADGLPKAWAAAGQTHLYGKGEVAFSGGAAAAGDWERY